VGCFLLAAMGSANAVTISVDQIKTIHVSESYSYNNLYNSGTLGNSGWLYNNSVGTLVNNYYLYNDGTLTNSGTGEITGTGNDC